jgi:hypothetical protein
MTITPHLLSEMEAEAARLGPEMSAYWNYSKQRFIFQTALVGRFIEQASANGETPRILDIGPSFQTLLLHRLWGDRIHLDTFGFTDPKFPPPGQGKHLPFDLNDAYYPDRWLRVDPYNVIVMFEVIEHLYTSPIQVLRYLHTLCAGGGYLFISNPNAVALQHRIKMLLGKHPYERIRENRDNPGHYRENTRDELSEMGTEAGFSVQEIHMQNLTSSGALASQIFKFCSRFMPPTLRKDVTIVFQNRKQQVATLIS